MPGLDQCRISGTGPHDCLGLRPHVGEQSVDLGRPEGREPREPAPHDLIGDRRAQESDR
jgi:hypothetical protein